MSTNGFPQEIDLKRKKRSKKMKWNRNTAGNFLSFPFSFLEFSFPSFSLVRAGDSKGGIRTAKKEHEYVWHKKREREKRKEKKGNIMSGYFGQDNLEKRSCPKKSISSQN